MSVAQFRGTSPLGLSDFGQIFRVTPAPMAVAQSDGRQCRIVEGNDAFCDLFGLSHPQLKACRVQNVFRATAGAQVDHAIEQCLADGEPVRFRIARIRGGDLVRLEVEVRRLAGGEAGGVLITATMLDRQIELSELGEAGVLAELGALSRGLVYIHDLAAKRLRYGRHPLAARLGLPGGTLDLDYIRSMLHTDDLIRFEAHAADQVEAADDRVSRTSFRMRGADGSWLWIEIRSRVFVRDAEGKVQRIIGVATDVTAAHHHAAALAEAASALANAELNERRRIGRELHDSTSQFLVAARLGLGALEGRIDLRAPDLRLLHEVRHAIADAQNEIRNFSYMLHPPSLQEYGLERALRTFTAGFARRSGIVVSMRAGRDPPRLPFAVEVALFRVAQEALMNVYRHSKARRANLRLGRSGDRVVLEIEDDGIGLPPERRSEVAGVGISGMRARMTQLGGDFALLPGNVGLKVRATVPSTAREM